MTEIFQHCPSCEKDLPVAEFWRARAGSDQLFFECKACARVRNREWFRGNRERHREANNGRTKRRRIRHPVTAMLISAKSRAKVAGIEFSLTEADIVVPTHCPVLGIELVWNYGHGRGWKLTSKDRSPSLDRVDNARGYVPGNVVVVSYRANRIKSDASVGELQKIARFYERITSSAGGRRVQPEDVSGQQKIQMPEMQPYAAQQARPLSLGEV